MAKSAYELATLSCPMESGSADASSCRRHSYLSSKWWDPADDWWKAMQTNKKRTVEDHQVVVSVAWIAVPLVASWLFVSLSVYSSDCIAIVSKFCKHQFIQHQGYAHIAIVINKRALFARMDRCIGINQQFKLLIAATSINFVATFPRLILNPELHN